MDVPRSFIGIGAQKAGTTTLARYLSAHPDVHMPAIKEMHFFNMIDDTTGHLVRRVTDDLRRRHRRLSIISKQQSQDLDTFADLMAGVRSVAERYEIGTDPQKYREMLAGRGATATLCGEITPAYATLNRTGMARIAQTLDRPKIIFILRNPVDRFLSQIKHGQSQLASVQQKPADPRSLLARQNLTLRSRYNETLGIVTELFPSEDILVDYFENMVGPQAPRFHDRLCNFLELDHEKAPQVSEGAEVAHQQCDPIVRDDLIKAFEDVYRDVEKTLGEVPDLWRADMERM